MKGKHEKRKVIKKLESVNAIVAMLCVDVFCRLCG